MLYYDCICSFVQGKEQFYCARIQQIKLTRQFHESKTHVLILPAIFRSHLHRDCCVFFFFVKIGEKKKEMSKNRRDKKKRKVVAGELSSLDTQTGLAPVPSLGVVSIESVRN
jgi:hypothetical protein